MFSSLVDMLRGWSIAPVIAINGSLLLLSTLLRPFFGRPSEVGEVAELFIHPIRALQPVQVGAAGWPLTPIGFWLDKRMCMLYRGERLKHTTPGWEALYGVGVCLTETAVVLSHASLPDLEVPLSILIEGRGEPLTCNKGCSYKEVAGAGSWLSKVVDREVQLVYSPEGAPVQSLDPVLIIGHSSLAAFEEDAGHTMEMERFRPNIVAVEQRPFADESWGEVMVGGAVLEFCHRCTRCSITNVSPEGIRTSYTMDSLKAIRPRCEKTNKPVFGSYFKVKCPGLVKPGDKILLTKSR